MAARPAATTRRDTARAGPRNPPQGSAVPPVLANLFLHYAFDAWMARTFPAVTFERYVDDAVVHCVSERQARYVLAAIRKRTAEVGLELHSEKTRIVYCQDDNRRGSHEHVEFTFLGYTFRRRSASRKDGGMFLSFIPAISREALSRISAEVRSWRLHHRTSLTEADLARKINPIVRGWVNYYGAFYTSARFPSWSASMPTRCGGCARSSSGCGDARKPRTPGTKPSHDGPGSSLTGPGPPTSPRSGDQNDKSRMTGDRHVRICEGRELRLLPATRRASSVSRSPLIVWSTELIV
ncbi:hypothetical protein GCM10010121_097120 [Streptomyces brasiliensis]|uniref:Reverse transcriptase domain-containing protein n=1 Tax=Streptomyces brasiliensis TaxID=1954 RepID=A0A917PCQ4_9ACTN|nr:hypothetical protein GCM10010121_097120 [Streptomyces brasiliensis]